MQVVNFLNYGPLDYMAMDSIQRIVHDDVAHLRMPDTLLVWEADHVYTAGRRTAAEDIPDSSIPVIRMDRGGSVTYHGPGQLVVYPVVKVRPPKDVVGFVRATERAIMAAMAGFSLHTEQVEGRSGVWVCGDGEDRKLCAIGIKFAEDATMHGLALNVSTDIERFNRIVPCGITDAGVTSLDAEGIAVRLDDVVPAVVSELAAAYEPFLLRNDEAITHADAGDIITRVQQVEPVELPAVTGSRWDAASVSPVHVSG
ncbi:lipoyl(octanoyl) transferase LipB [Trueperella bialowiezensis]|uniref:Octanoyltransferase n=1 Tax=Trueperella bialowiezensis TaxID=312285 RepID=A0A448PDG8_9ACTO|nr:lipoyl(octanoyl) transferase LipB [Trueperella bialowiezensis]VEI12955.1 Octanoyltransferase [Trueperella bialowiezensis]